MGDCVKYNCLHLLPVTSTHINITMDSPILSSTFFLTLLLLVGLIFFLRAATKDRTELMRLSSDQDEDTLMTGLKSYFQSRAYKVIAVDSTKNQVTFEGFVSPSWFLAVFLTFLAAVGLLCLWVVLSFLFPDFGQFFLILVILSPLSGILYWRKSGRLEQVSLKMENNNISNNISSEQHPSSIITLIGHRDELLELQKTLQLKSIDG
jgi:hypothetical protein